jgi:hypothetical protein
MARGGCLRRRSDALTADNQPCAAEAWRARHERATLFGPLIRSSCPPASQLPTRRARWGLIAFAAERRALQEGRRTHTTRSLRRPGTCCARLRREPGLLPGRCPHRDAMTGAHALRGQRRRARPAGVVVGGADGRDGLPASGGPCDGGERCARHAGRRCGARGSATGSSCSQPLSAAGRGPGGRLRVRGRELDSWGAGAFADR